MKGMKRSLRFTDFVWIALILLVLFRYEWTRPAYKNGDRVRVYGRVMSEPVKFERVQGVKLKGLRAYLPLYPEISYGDRVLLEGFVENGKLSGVELLSLESGSNLLFRFRERLVEFYMRALPQPHGALVAGIVMGSKVGISRQFYESLRESGTLHVVVASGMNVTLVAGFLMSTTLLFLPRKKAVAVALLGVWLYALMSGFDAPIVRAAIMGSIAFWAQALGRVYSAWRGLFVAALLMLVVNPRWVGDLGFMLSFTATASLMLLSGGIKNRLRFVPGIVRNDLATTLAASIGVAPIIYFAFGTVNLLSPLVNALVLWTIPVITILGMVGGVVGSRLILLLVYPLTSWFVFVVELFG